VQVTEIVVLDGAEGHASLRDLLATASPPPTVTLKPAENLAVLPYSSGTTGKAKGVMLTHRNLVANLCQVQPLLRVGEGTRLLAVLPFFHIYGMTLLMNHALWTGATVVTMPKFDLAEFLRVVSEHRTNRIYIAPPVAVALAKHPLVDQYDLSCVDIVFSGAAPLDADLGHAVGRRIGCIMRQGYGMTEMSPVSHVIPDDGDSIDLNSVGPCIPNMQCKIVDPETGEELGAGGRGELWCKGPNIMKGYLNNPEATAITIDADGFLHTGDVATVDKDGNFTIVDRVKELIKYQVQGVPGAAGRAGGAAADPRADRRRGGDRGARRRGRGGPEGVRRAPGRQRPDRGRGHGLRRRAHRPAQESSGRRVHRPDPEVGVRQDPAEGPTRAGGRREVGGSSHAGRERAR
jgi:acyl-CoA synthetase (AMP-forming)/AMP-acid ligase II